MSRGATCSDAGSIPQSAKIIAPKVAALIAKQGSTPTVAIRMPAIPGPAIRATWIRTLLRLTALTTRSAPTISIAKLWRVGLSTAFTVPRAKTIAKTISGVTTPVTVTVKRTSAGSAIIAWVMISRRRLEKRSASSPPQAPNSSMGRNCRAVVSPTAIPLSVSERTSQISATVCIQFPDRETTCPQK